LLASIMEKSIHSSAISYLLAFGLIAINIDQRYCFANKNFSIF
jgi:hypothetical protein